MTILQGNKINPDISNVGSGSFKVKHFKEKKELPSGFYKFLILDILNLAAIALLGYAAKFYFEDKIDLIRLIISIFFFLSIVLIASALNQNWTKRTIILLAESFIIFYILFGFSKINIFGGLILVFFILRIWSEIKIYFYLQNNIKVKFSLIAQQIFSKTISAIILFLIIFYVFSLGSPLDFFSYNLFQNLWNSFSSLYQKFYPEININNSFDDFIVSLVNFEIKKQDSFKDLLPTERETAINIMKEDIRNQISKKVNMNLDGNKKFSEFVYDVIYNQFNGIYKVTNEYFLVFILIFLFLFWRGIAAVGGIIFRGFAFILFHILIALGFIKLDTRSVAQEFMTF